MAEWMGFAILRAKISTWKESVASAIPPADLQESHIVPGGRDHGRTSVEQRAVADRAAEASLVKGKLAGDELLGSHWMKAMQRDYDQFGEDAFKEGWPGMGGKK